ncbi:MAG: DUF4124 domain-containing protein [Gammaproteobacteria bacterium]|nr:DUF4124 domain-containing protein [Gammaproteobacteria bacterium]
MRLLALALLALPALLPAGASAQATLNKCIGAEGKITYSNLPCRNAREARKVEIDPAPTPDQARPAPAPVEPAPKAVPPSNETATLRLDTQRTTGKPAARAASGRQCDALTDKLGRVFDKMDAARRKGYTQDQMNAWDQEVKDLERKKQQSGCF